MPVITLGTVAGTTKPSSGTTLSNGNLTALNTSAATHTFRMINVSNPVASTYMFRQTGVYWMEFTVVTVAGSTASPVCGAGSNNTAPAGNIVASGNLSVRPSGAAWQVYAGTNPSGGTFGSFTAGNTYKIGIVVDIANEQGKVYIDNTAASGLITMPGGSLWLTTGVTPGITMLIINEQITVNFGYDANGVYTPATYLSTYLADFPKALPWQDEKFHPTIRPVISPRPVSHIRL